MSDLTVILTINYFLEQVLSLEELLALVLLLVVLFLLVSPQSDCSEPQETCKHVVKTF